jgi:hypothetical protein
MTISAIDRIRLESMLGMLGSDHVGERDNAAKLIEQFLRKRGLTWPDVLGHSPAGNNPSGQPGNRQNQAFWKPAPRAAYARPVRVANPAQDVVWRWSMLLGLAMVGAISLLTLLQQRAAEPRITADAVADGRCLVAVERSGVPGCPTFAGAEIGIKSPSGVATVAAAVAAGNHRPSASFAQGVADRKVAESWHKVAPPRLCAGHFGPDREEFRSACVTAEKLLTQFDQRRRSDPEYRRGWNSLS